MEGAGLKYVMEVAGLGSVMEAAGLKETYMKHEDSELIFWTPSCMDSIVLDILEIRIKESAKIELG